MLFNSYVFLFAFLPITWAIFRCLSYIKYKMSAISWLIISSILFYSYWNPKYLFLLLVSVSLNFCIGKWLSRDNFLKKKIFILGLIFNLSLLAYYKYVNFFIDNINKIFFNEIFTDFNELILPLGISFWTFQQISYLTDVYYNKGDVENEYIYYLAYIFFFPHLIAGPIIHHRILIKQLKQDKIFRLSYKNLTLGLCFLSIGLFKKVVVADSLSPWVIDVFDTSKDMYSFGEAWMAAIAYTMQIYFDFSGYSDMAMGLARLFNINFPINFYSPYKAVSIIDFWRRWHITLSSFLRDYLYIPLGGKYHRYRNLLITMLFGGLWHGAGWNFVVWGGLHGSLLCINHYWHRVNINFKIPSNSAWTMTFISVLCCWVFFRAHSLEQACSILTSMLNIQEIETVIQYKKQYVVLIPLLIGCRLIPETWEFLELKKNAKGLSKVILCIILMFVSIFMINSIPTEFLYFQF